MRASAPVRLDFAGAWTDVAPFATEAGGVVVNAAIELRAYAEIAPGGDTFRLHAADLREQRELVDREQLSVGTDLGMLRAALRMSHAGPCSLRTWSDAPPGAGLGGSGALGVALVAVTDSARAVARTPVEIAEAAHQLEAVETAHAGGKQDQYAAALGGFNQLRFINGSVAVTPLRLDRDFADQLARQTVVCYTGQSRVSGDTITRVMDAYSRRVPQVVTALHKLVEIGERMAEALQSADLIRIGELLGANWEQQRRLDERMCTAEMKSLEAAMESAGAVGGKAAGAGAGGSMFFVITGDRAAAVSAAQRCGATVLPIRWAASGVEVVAT